MVLRGSGQARQWFETYLQAGSLVLVEMETPGLQPNRASPADVMEKRHTKAVLWK